LVVMFITAVLTKYGPCTRTVSYVSKDYTRQKPSDLPVSFSSTSGLLLNVGTQNL
jgi:hypothetical protein